MNPNIKVINDGLWLVNFSHVGMGFIKEIAFNKTLDSDFMTLTQDGKLIMNSGDDITQKYLPLMKVVMTFPNRWLGNENGFCQFIKVFLPKLDHMTNEEVLEFVKQQNLDNLKLAFNTACKWEVKRRQLYKSYSKKHWISNFINRVKKFFKRKVGEK